MSTDKTDVTPIRFADEWLKANCNGVLAAQRLNLSSTYFGNAQAAHELLKNPETQKRINKRLAHAFTMPIAEPIGILVQQARASIDDLLDESGQITREKVKENGHLVKKLKTKRVIEGKGDDAREVEYTEVELYSAQVAADKLCEITGLKRPAEVQPNNTTNNVLIVVAQSALENAMKTLPREQAVRGLIELRPELEPYLQTAGLTDAQTD